jgi:hypothetical protein
VGDAYFLAFHYYFRVAGTFVGGSSSGSPCTLSDPSCSFDINRSSALGIVSTGLLARFRGLPLLSRITIGYSPLVFAFEFRGKTYNLLNTAQFDVHGVDATT